jgi:hypothetical protein
MRYVTVIMAILLVGALTASAQVSVYFRGGPTHIYPGEWIDVGLKLVNETDEWQLFEIWSTFETEEEQYEISPRPLILPPAKDFKIVVPVYVPTIIDPGEYYASVYVGEYPDDVWSEDHATVEVLEEE